MFALEINFHDGVSPSEVIFVRRPHAIIGNSDAAHVVIEGAYKNLTEIRLCRGVGREFTCHPLRGGGRNSFVEGSYLAEAEFDLGGITAHITSLDLDLRTLPDESPDRAGVRILRRSLLRPTPVFPAVAVLGGMPLFVSFPIEQPLLIGRARSCALRLDSVDVSSEHARIGLDRGAFWVEDLGSTNGTFVGTERISGRRSLAEGERIKVGGEILLACINSPEEISNLKFSGGQVKAPVAKRRTYPALVGNSDVIKPEHYPLSVGGRVTVGRDPASDIWVAAAHISRVHFELTLQESGKVELIDLSSNGTFLAGDRLTRGEPVILPAELSVIDLNAGVQIALCFSGADAQQFRGEDELSRPTDELHHLFKPDEPNKAPPMQEENRSPVIDDTQIFNRSKIEPPSWHSLISTEADRPENASFYSEIPPVEESPPPEQHAPAPERLGQFGWGENVGVDERYAYGENGGLGEGNEYEERGRREGFFREDELVDFNESDRHGSFGRIGLVTFFFACVIILGLILGMLYPDLKEHFGGIERDVTPPDPGLGVPGN